MNLAMQFVQKFLFLFHSSLSHEHGSAKVQDMIFTLKKQIFVEIFSPKVVTKCILLLNLETK